MMEFGFCELAVIPLRSEPSDRSEMSSQLLFGDLVEVLEHRNSWLYLKNVYDAYQGWVDIKQICPIEKDEFLRLSEAPLFVNSNLVGDKVKIDGKTMILAAGSSFYGLNEGSLTAGGREFKFNGTAIPFYYTGTENLLKVAMNYLSCPYLWGGKTCMGLDCSGFTQIVYKQNGIRLMRDAARQAEQGEMINFISDSLPGDLAFFDNEEGTITHVGILIDGHSILHCSGSVRIDAIDHQGIFNRELNKYTHKLRLIRRVLSV